MVRASPNFSFIKAAKRQQGLMLIIVLIFFAMSSYAALKSSEVWATVVTREQEQELLFVGNQYRKAIERYYYAKPVNERALPISLIDLVKDDRFPAAQHHLRKLYDDPFHVSDTEAWGILRSGKGIVGVYSLSDKKPIKKSNFENPYEKFEAAQSYRDWKFTFAPPAPLIPATNPQSRPAPATPAVNPVLK
jgi:type II secretory pathway pseudopilin PulG